MTEIKVYFCVETIRGKATAKNKYNSNINNDSDDDDDDNNINNNNNSNNNNNKIIIIIVFKYTKAGQAFTICIL